MKIILTYCVLVSAVICCFLVLCFEYFVAGDQPKSTLQILCRVLSYSSLSATLSLLAVDRAWFHMRKLQDLFGVPLYHGRWIGWYRSDISGRWEKTAHEIRQDLLSCRCTAFGPRNISKQMTWAIDGGRGMLVWTYQANQLDAVADPGGNHTGVHLMQMSQRVPKLLLGSYINNRLDYRRTPIVAGATGIIFMMYSGKTFLDGLHAEQEGWPTLEDVVPSQILQRPS